ncbi:Permease of the drug/metabolite transporter (DMT) superfamily [Methanolobus vulcani]|uniref:Permease of the drug/metabolite transporter (DMT) superfamily n=1 Tax=Methanolobus vulcani TaxID=38026 RepID=A0A7Z7AZH3_9EURY|nr:DMT family transporter [Methanolobus vulcani]SDG38459.1 Permease of the drug/metabolite transporter (DMT) superfamily [Methanolobus vulcani]
MKSIKSGKYSYLELIISCTVFGASGIFLNHIYNMQTVSIIFYRLIFGFVLLLAYCICAKKYNMLYIHKKKRYIILIAIFNVLTLYTYFSSIKYAGISIAVLLLYTAPVYVTLLSPLFLKDKITKRGIFSLLISVCGILLVVLPGSTASVNAQLFTGIVLGILSGLSYSGTIMTVSYLKDEYSGLTQLFWSTFISLLILLPFGSRVKADVLIPNLYVLFLFGLITTAFASVLYLNSASKIRAQTVSVLALLEPVSGIIFGFVFLHEPVFMNTIQGCFFILLGASILVLEPGKLNLQRKAYGKISIMGRIYPVLSYLTASSRLRKW